MKDNDIRIRVKEAVPEVPKAFYEAIENTFSSMAQNEEDNTRAFPKKPMLNKRRALAFVLAAILMIATVAVAATLLTHNVFYVTLGDSPANAASITQYDLAKETFGNVEVAIKEAAYDGMSLYVVYSIRDLTATEMLGKAQKEGELRYISEVEYEQMVNLGVGWWTDNLWINGKSISDMPVMSGGETIGGEQPGEALYYLQFRLDQIDLYLEGKDVEISMPIGERQPLGSLKITRDPYSAQLPEKGIVSFKLDCTKHKGITVTEPNIVTEGPNWSAKVIKAVYSPIQMYVTLEWAVKPELLEAYIAENGDGIYNENGVKLFDYGGMDIFGDEIRDMQLVDENGKPVFETMEGFYGCGGYGSENAWFTFPYKENYPEKMYLAPVFHGEADMNLAVQVK
jgi:hypothetical protein